jgi:hypothetical protein
VITTIDAPARLEVANVALLSDVSTGPGKRASFRFEIEQRLFGLGFGRAASARAWYRRYEWTELRRRLGLVGMFLALAKRPARVIRESLKDVAAHGQAVRDAYGVPIWKQRAQLCWLGFRYGLDGESYYRFWLFRRDRRRQAGKYIQQHEAGLLYRVLAVRDAMDDFRITEDKRRFAAWCEEQGLPTARVLAEFTGGACVRLSVPGGIPERDLFSKPIDGFGGAGAQRWSYTGRERWKGTDGREYDERALVDALAKQSETGAVLLQVCIANDPAIRHLTSGALCTARMMTIRPPAGRPELACAVFRMPTGGQSTDNFSIAGLAAAVDIASGRLGAGVKSDPRLIIAPVEKHPDTGATLDGNYLPWWSEAKTLVIDAHDRLKAMACVGWDVALTPSGPVLIEANWAPGARLAQAPSGIPLGATNFMRYLDQHMRRSFARQ